MSGKDKNKLPTYTSFPDWLPFPVTPGREGGVEVWGLGCPRPGPACPQGESECLGGPPEVWLLPWHEPR